MNILHLKYAVEVSKCGSINKASDKLIIAQPNLSRAIKDLEADLGITIFDRSAKGMFLTRDGEHFIARAEKILAEIEEIKSIYKERLPIKQKLSVSCTAAGYISESFSALSLCLSPDPTDISYKEALPHEVLSDVIKGEFKLGIIRYFEEQDKYYKELFEEKNLTYELIAEFDCFVILSAQSPLAASKAINSKELNDLLEISYTSFSETSSRGTIHINDRAAQLELLSSNYNTFMLDAPLPEAYLKRYNLVQKKCTDIRKSYKDVLIYKKDSRLSELDNSFITQLCNSKRKCLSFNN